MNRVSPHHVRRESEELREAQAIAEKSRAEKQEDQRLSTEPMSTSWYFEVTMQQFCRTEVAAINTRKLSVPPFDLSASTEKRKRKPILDVSGFDD